MKKIKVLVVDDSFMFRNILVKGLSEDPAIEVVGTANDPFEARDMIIKYEPDVMTLDVELPRMDGIEFLRKLIPQHPMPVVMISACDGKVFDALNAGAVDFINKPVNMTSEQIQQFIKSELVTKVKIASTVKTGKLKRNKYEIRNSESDTTSYKYGNKLIALGASTGGTEAICSVLMGLDRNVPGIVITQHMPQGFTKMFAERLNNQTRLVVSEAQNGDVIRPGCAYIAPGDKQMKILKVGEQYRIECVDTVKVNGHCPSVDVLFESVATACKNNAIGVILTGMGADGAKGLLKMRQMGAKTIGQNESSCIVYGMPKVANELGGVEVQLHLDQIPKKIYDILEKLQ